MNFSRDDNAPSLWRTNRHKSIDERILELQDVVILGPSANTKVLRVARGSGAVVVLVGLCVAALGLLSVIVTAANEYSSGHAMGRASFILFCGVMVFLVGRLILGIARRCAVKRGAVTRETLTAAPQEFTDAFRLAVNAADIIGESLAYREGWLAEANLDAALWDLARHLKTGTRLHDVLEAAPVGLEYREQVERARAALDGCLAHLRAGADRLTGLVSRVEALDMELTAPARRAELEVMRELRARRDAEQMSRLSAAAAEVETIEPVFGDVADSVTGVLDAYDELPQKRF
ncbi:hypothetical protein HCA61_22595 [Rhodococcus sp. HNM0563]|uniref:hypothetical protein n=1 Tax=Rhodococcus sp. HNM0563 TaxID=2716339 RepID=UPI00146AD057|nr:hypothetical protein [Rhodococcus sp. HNM0563]NLU65030.1 hypothetical protein [Rhodococcus sp. HNM0563]